MNAVEELNYRLGIGPSRPHLPITLQRSGYSAVRQLGKGSFGNAYLVYHAERKEHYVVKHVNMANMSARQRKDAHQEIALLQQLEYPNIIRYVEFCEEFPHLYIVMEYADGGDVYTHLKNLKRSVWALGVGGGGGGGGLTEEHVISLFVQTTMAVKYMHDRRLLHRDIKSQNVFLTQNHVVKLGDFGISTVLMSTVAMAQTVCGTPCYFSPELCEGKPYNNKSDVWALGVFLYELCTTGRLPFEAVTMNRLMDEICKKEPRRIPANFSDELWNLVLWMLKKDSRQRPDAGQILRSPVLVRAIPDLIKKLSATDSRCETEYKRLFSLDATPLPPIRYIDLQQQRRKNEGNGNKLSPSVAAAAAAAAALPGAGRFDIFRKRNDEYPFKRAPDIDLAKDGLGGDFYGALAARRQEANKKEGERAASNAPPASPPALGDATPTAGQENTPAGAAQHFLEAMNHRGGRKGRAEEPPAEPKDGRLPPPPPPQRQRQRQPPLELPSKQTPGKTPLKDLFLIYDERKKRMAMEREQRLNLPRGPMNYQPSGVSPFRGRPSAAEEKPAYSLPKQKPPLLEPSRLIDKDLKELLAERQKAEDNVAPVASGVNAQCAGDSSEKLKGHVCNENKGKDKSNSNNGNGDIHNKDGGVNGPRSSAGDLALVLQEMTTHFELVQGNVLRAGSRQETGDPACTGVEAADGHPLAVSKHDEDDVGQEFADVMGTTLDLKDLKRKTATSSDSAVDIELSEANEPIPLFLARNDAVRTSRSNSQLSVRVGGLRDLSRRSSSGVSGPVSFSVHTPRPATLSPTSVPGLDVPMAASGGEGPGFDGGCLCDGIRFTGLASTIFGSFVCNCMVCARFSGAMMGVEWLHLPDVPFEFLFADTPSPSSSPSPPPAQAAKPNAEDAEKPRNAGGGSPRFPPQLTRLTMELPLMNEDGTQGTGTYTVYFCGRCGSTIGMDHNDIPGSLVAKAALSDVSLAVLESFQQTMPQSTVDGGCQ